MTRCSWLIGLATGVVLSGLLGAATRSTSAPTRPVAGELPKPQKLRLLRLLPLEVGRQRFDPSGLTLGPGGTLLTVNDKLSFLRVFSLSLPGGGAKQVVRVQPLVTGTKKVRLPVSKVWPGMRYYLDLEGVTRCGGALWVAAEQLRHVFRIDPRNGKTTQHPLNFSVYERQTARKSRPIPRFSISLNAGLEGIACDEKGRRLYLIQERQPRMVLVAAWPKTWRDGATLTLVDHFDLPSFWLPRRVHQIDLPPDFSGAFFDRGALYVIYRNARLLLKVDPRQHALQGVVSYAQVEDALYQSNMPFGMAEGLAMDATRIWLIFDNNLRARKQFPNDHRPVLAEFARPSGF